MSRDSQHSHPSFTIDTANQKAVLAGLALLIDAIPAQFREDILRAALRVEPSNGFDESYLVGMVRTQLYDCLVEQTGELVSLAVFQSLNAAMLSRWLTPFSTAADPAEMTLALLDLLAFLVNTLKTASEHVYFD